MVALYRCGRQAEALAAYREAHARARGGAGARAGTAAARAGAHGAAPGPGARRAGRRGPAGCRAMARASSAARPSSPRSSTTCVPRGSTSLVGPAGAGKTRLAAEVAGRAVAGWARTCGGSSSARSGRVASSPRRRARSRPPRCPAGRPSMGRRAARARRPACSYSTTASTSSRRRRRSPGGCSVGAGSADPRDQPRGAAARRGAHPPARGPRRAGAATRLLRERGSGNRRDRASPAASADAIVERLDGLPLAIELAAASCARSPSPSSRAACGAAVAARRRAARRALAAAYARRRDRVGPRAPGGRRATGAAAVVRVPWQLRRRAAEAVASGEGVEPAAVVPALARLVDASLLAADPPRYRLLMTVRAFARECLRAAGEEEAAPRAPSRCLPGAGRGGRAQHGQRRARDVAAARAPGARELPGRAALVARPRRLRTRARVRGVAFLYWFRSGFVKDGRAAARAGDGSGGSRRAAVAARALRARAARPRDRHPGPLATADAAVAAADAAGDAELLALSLCLRAHALLAEAEAPRRTPTSAGHARSRSRRTTKRGSRSPTSCSATSRWRRVTSRRRASSSCAPATATDASA